MATYYTLAIRWTDEPGAKFCPEFGDYDREVVADEGISAKEQAIFEGRKIACRIIRTRDHQDDINAAIAKLNQEG